MSPLTGRAKTAANNTWIERNGLVQFNVHVPLAVREEFRRECERRGLSQRAALVEMIDGWLALCAALAASDAAGSE